MIKEIKENRLLNHKTISSRIENYDYRARRYKQSYALAIGYTEDGIDISNFSEYTRQTDFFIELDKNLCCVVFDNANISSGIKASTNMLVGFQQGNFGKIMYTSVVCSDQHEKSSTLIHELFDVLEYSILNNMNNMVVDAQQMMR